MPSERGPANPETAITLSDPEVDLEGVAELWTGYSIENSGVQESIPAFQMKQDYVGETWILRWSTRRRQRDPESDLKRELSFALDELELTDTAKRMWEEGIPEAYLQTPEVAGLYEGSQVESLNGALNTGFSIDEVLEKTERCRSPGDTFYFSVSDPSRSRTYRVEVLEDVIKKGLEGRTRFSYRDTEFLREFDESVYESLIEELGSKTSHLDTSRE